MKVLVVLALATFTGCHASHSANEPKPQLLADAFWGYVAKVTQTADDTVQQIRKSPAGKDINAHFPKGDDDASQYTASQPPLGLIRRIIIQADALIEHVNQDLSSVVATLDSYTEGIKAKYQQRVQQLKYELAPYESTDAAALKTMLILTVEELKAQLGPLNVELKNTVDQRLQDFQAYVFPMVDTVQDELANKAQQLDQMVAPYVEYLGETLNRNSQDLHAQVTSLYQSFSKTK